MSFDDHEVDNNWVSAFDHDGTPPEAFLLRRFAAMQAWYENVPVRRAQFPRPEGLQMYRQLDYGQLVRMHVLDTRSHRSEQLCERTDERACRKTDEPGSTMLGARQEAWLGEGLANDVRWNLIAQQVRVMPLVRKNETGQETPAAMDTWSGYPAARERLIQTIMDRKLTNVVIATGDSHIHNVGIVPERADALDGPAVATEFLGTSISSGGDGMAQSELASAYMHNNPHFDLVNQQRGYQLFEVTPSVWKTDVKVIDKVQSPGGALSTLARFVVRPDKPGLHRG
jgi:alkaline phosphatase D